MGVFRCKMTEALSNSILTTLWTMLLIEEVASGPCVGKIPAHIRELRPKALVEPNILQSYDV